jgi:hypothetical protein
MKMLKAVSSLAKRYCLFRGIEEAFDRLSSLGINLGGLGCKPRDAGGAASFGADFARLGAAFSWA